MREWTPGSYINNYRIEHDGLTYSAFGVSRGQPEEGLNVYRGGEHVQTVRTSRGCRDALRAVGLPLPPCFPPRLDESEAPVEPEPPPRRPSQRPYRVMVRYPDSLFMGYTSLGSLAKAKALVIGEHGRRTGSRKPAEWIIIDTRIDDIVFHYPCADVTAG